MNYKCIRKCHYGRIFRPGDIVSFQETPPHHFELVEDAEPTVVSKKEISDPMKPASKENVSSLSQFVTQPKAAGFASSLPAPEIITQVKKAGRPRKNK